ncbi:MAG: glycosyltransferase [Lachnospiraceae bacterium]|nr:glycosyltransferase [Lachnospiraceae bacterium]
MKPLVSVCIPAYNSAGYIMDTVNSILNQTYRNLELVVVDDCSTDDTYEVLRAIQDERLKLYRNEHNLGMSGNWNRCLKLCSGEYVKLICADDLLAENALELEVSALEENPTAVIAESDTKLVDLDGGGKGFYKRYGKKGLVDGRKICRRGFFNKDYFGAPQANTFRRSVAEKIGGFDPAFTYILDYDFFVSLACEGDVYIIHESLNFFRVRKESNTGAVMGEDKEKTAVYVAEHCHLLEKNRQRLQLSGFDIWLSVLIRRFRCFAASVYLKLFVHK